MIREFLTYLSQKPALKEARIFGHLNESIAIFYREKRCHKDWAPHRNQCKGFISEHLKTARHLDSVLVLGSGLLHEIPIETLSKTFKRVVLVDIVHLNEVKKSVAHLKNVEFSEHDITEIESDLLTQNRLIEKVPTAFLNEEWGLILSINLMSQLPLHLETFVKKTFSQHSSFAIESFLKAVTKNHLLYLQSFKAPVILISDTQTSYYDKKDNLLQKEVNYPHLELPIPDHEWTWYVAPIPEFQKDIAMKMTVSAFVLKSANSR